MYVNRKSGDRQSASYFAKYAGQTNTALYDYPALMPITVTIHESKQFIIAKYEGKVTDAELIPAYANFFAQHACYAALPELSDISSADLSGVSHRGLTELATWTAQFFNDHGIKSSKTAMYNPPGENYKSQAVIYEAWTVGSPENCRTFASREEAIRWLTFESKK